MAKAIFLVCAFALFAQCAQGQCLGPIAAAPLPTPLAAGLEGLAYDGFAGWPIGRLGFGAIAPVADIAAASSLNAAYGGGLPVASASPAAPTGLAVASENAYEGAVAVAGNLPFLGTVAMEGVFPTAGAGAVSYGCGDGAVAIAAEGSIADPAAIVPEIPAAIAPAAAIATNVAIAPGMAPHGLRGIGIRGYACGAPFLY